MLRLTRRLKRVFHRDGVLGLVRVARDYFAAFLRGLAPSVRTERRGREKRSIMFDEEFGVDTAGCIHQTELIVDSPNQRYAVAFGSSDPYEFRRAMNALAIDTSSFVFVDYGSGKGRAVLLAMEYRFKKIIGIEFCEKLHVISKEDVKRVLLRTMNVRSDVELLCLDAVDYQLPNDPLVLYLCNPFGPRVMAKILLNIRLSLCQARRQMFIGYYNPKEASLVDESGQFDRFGKEGAGADVANKAGLRLPPREERGQ